MDANQESTKKNGGVCTRFNMKFELAIQEAVGEGGVAFVKGVQLREV